MLIAVLVCVVDVMIEWFEQAAQQRGGGSKMGNRVKVKQVVEKQPKSAAEPVLLQFEHSDINPNVDVGGRLVANIYETDQRNPTFRGPMNPGSALKRKQVVVVQGETDMTYIGTSDSLLNSNSGDLRTFIAIRDRKNKMRIYEASTITVSPYLDGRAHLQHTDSALKTIEDRLAANVDLVKAFGSKKKKSVLERREKNKIESEDMSESINTATDSAKITEDAPTAASEDSILQLVPPCNRETSDIRAVYLLSDILSKDELQEMDDMAKRWLGTNQNFINDMKESKLYSDYFFAMWKTLSPRKSDPKNILAAKMVLYTEVLICLFKLNPYELRKQAPKFPNAFPKWLVDKALDTFTPKNANNLRCRPEPVRDRICCYIFVLVLLANEFFLDVQLMSTTLQIHIKKLLNLARAVGISYKMNPTTKEYSARLKLPLVKPVERRGRQRATR